jgi:hypothetical protein
MSKPWIRLTVSTFWYRVLILTGAKPAPKEGSR